MPDFYYVAPVGPFAQKLTPTAFASFTTKQSVTTLPLPSIPAGVLRAGSIVKIEAEGEYGTTGTPTLVWGLFLGTHDGTDTNAPTITTDIALSSAITTPSGAAAFDWRLEWRGRVTKTGSSGLIVGNGTLEQGTSLTARSSFPIPITQALRTVAINTTIANAVGVSATYGASSASNTIATYDITVLIMN